jgi:hypothetical protein
MQIEKNISFFIEQQFPAIYKESGRELIAIMEEYYKWLETAENQSVYNARRLFEYRDIDTTMSSMLIFFKNKFLSELPFDENTTRFIVKNILALYRRRGTTEGLKLFFRIFHNTDAEVYLPAKDIFKTSSSKWNQNPYIALFPNTGRFFSPELNKIFTYKDLNGRTIKGSVSEASAIVDRVNIIVINKAITPILYLNDMKGKFSSLDSITTIIDNSIITFGTVYGSVDSIDIDTTYDGTTGNFVGDIVTVSSSKGRECKAIVTAVDDRFTGQISYSLLDGGFGYTVDNAKLLVSNQSIKYAANSAIQNSDFIVLERVEDQFGNKATVIGYNDDFVGFRLDDNNEFLNTSDISTLDRANNVTFSSSEIFAITPKNNSSPGSLYPETANTFHVTAEIENTSNQALITDIIGNFTSVLLNSSNYNNVPPALIPMSGNTNPTTINTKIEDAFDPVVYEFGSIKTFVNVSPGADYVNDVFAVAFDPIIDLFDRFPQVITLENIGATLSIGDTVTQNGVGGKIYQVIGKTIFVLPYSYYGFNDTDPIVYKNNNYNIVSISKDYSSKKYGFNAIVDPNTEFATGRILAVEVINSGFGYHDNQYVDILDSNQVVAARATLNCKGTGITGGFWSTTNSHLNGYKKTLASNGVDEYYESGKFVRDNDFYQEYSYQVISDVDRSSYEELLKELIHVSGTRIFSKFRIQDYQNESRNIRYRVNLNS